MSHARLLRSIVALCAVFSWIVVAAGCPGTLTDEEKEMFQGGGVCPDVPSLLVSKCGTAGCHVEGASAAGALDLISPNVESRLVGVAGTAGCNSMPLVDPTDAANSLLYAKIVDPPPCGLKMPLGATLTTLEIDCIKTWIEGL